MGSLRKSSEVQHRERAERILRDVGQHGTEGVPIAEAALALAMLERPEIDPLAYRDHLVRLAEPLAPDENSNEGRMRALSRRFREEFGYQGDSETYDDLENANLMGVIDRRRGLPVALGILYMHAARAQSWGMSGLAFPGHFLLRLDADGEHSVVDPFHDGRILDAPMLRALFRDITGEDAMTPAHCTAVSDVQVLARLQNNLKIRHLRAGELARALSIIESMLLFAEDGELWREAGLVQARLGSLKAAQEALSRSLEMAPLSSHAAETRSLLNSLGRQLN